LFEIHCDTCKAHSVAQAVINVLPGPNAPADYTPKLSAPVEIEAEEVEHLEQLLEGSSPHNLTSLFLTHE
jgi:hypothetical protein